MKLRIIGSADLVNRLSAVLAEAGVQGLIYASRHTKGELRWYADVDDRHVDSALQTVTRARS